MLPHFLAHYEAFSERITVFDGGSTDRSVEILRAHPSVRLVTSDMVLSHEDGRYSEPVLMRLRNEEYKASRGEADWVAVVDIDEFIYHPRLVETLTGYKAAGITFPKVEGFDMVSDGVPSDGKLTEHARMGFANSWYCKNAVFDPQIDINFHFGCHRCSPSGPVVQSPIPEIKLLHYRFLGEEHFARKYAARAARIDPESARNGWGTVIGVPGAAGLWPVVGVTLPELRRTYREILGEQEIVQVLP